MKKNISRLSNYEYGQLGKFGEFPVVRARETWLFSAKFGTPEETWTISWFASMTSANEKVVEALLDAGASKSKEDDQGRTSRHF